MSSGPTPKVFAHRGASRLHPENTIVAFEAARNMGADGVELDVRPSADGCLVVHHDPTLADGGRISTLTRHDLPASVPLLGPVLEACGDLIVNIEIKTDPDDPDYDSSGTFEDQLVELMTTRKMGERALVSSFDRKMLGSVRSLDPAIRTAVLSRRDDDAIGHAVRGGHVAVHPWSQIVTEHYIVDAHDSGLLINVWTVDDPDEMVELAALGVDGLVTNVPDVALKTLGR